MKAPLIRIVNINRMLNFNTANKYMADPFYDHLRSMTDMTSFLITDLETLKNWKPLSSPVYI
jgi:hypothetical protein